MPMGSRAAQNCPVRSSQITQAKMPSREFHSSLESPYLRGCRWVWVRVCAVSEVRGQRGQREAAAR